MKKDRFKKDGKTRRCQSGVWHTGGWCHPGYSSQCKLGAKYDKNTRCHAHRDVPADQPKILYALLVTKDCKNRQATFTAGEFVIKAGWADNVARSWTSSNPLDIIASESLAFVKGCRTNKVNALGFDPFEIVEIDFDINVKRAVA